MIQQDETEQKITKLANLSKLRRYYSKLKEGIRDQCIERANMLRASKHSNLKIMRFGWRIFRMAVGRSILIKRRIAGYNEVL